jgi:hypothetical protein
VSEEQTPAAAPVAVVEPALEATPTTAPAAEVTPQEPATDPVSEAKAKELAKEAQSLRKRLRDTEAELQARKDAELTETEQAQKRADEAVTALNAVAARIKAANLKAAVTAAAVEGGLDPILALKLVKDDAEYDDQDEPTNVTELLDALKTAHPQLTKNVVQPSGSTANPASNQPAAESDADRLARLYGNRGGIDPLRNPELLGGGVVYTNQ